MSTTDRTFWKEQHAKQMQRLNFEVRKIRGKVPSDAKFYAMGYVADAFATYTAEITDVFYRAIVLIEYAIHAHNRDPLLKFINSKLDEIEKEVRKGGAS